MGCPAVHRMKGRCGGQAWKGEQPWQVEGSRCQSQREGPDWVSLPESRAWKVLWAGHILMECPGAGQAGKQVRAAGKVKWGLSWRQAGPMGALWSTDTTTELLHCGKGASLLCQLSVICCPHSRHSGSIQPRDVLWKVAQLATQQQPPP